MHTHFQRCHQMSYNFSRGTAISLQLSDFSSLRLPVFPFVVSGEQIRSRVCGASRKRSHVCVSFFFSFPVFFVCYPHPKLRHSTQTSNLSRVATTARGRCLAASFLTASADLSGCLSGSALCFDRDQPNRSD